MEREGKGNFAERAWQWSKFTPTPISNIDSVYPWQKWRGCHFTSATSFPKHITWSNYKKIIRQIPIEGHFTKCLTRTLQNCQGHKKKNKSLRNCHSQEEASGDMMINIILVSWVGTWHIKGTFGENWGNLNGVNFLVNNKVTILVH